MKNILLVDDHVVVRTGMKVILQDYYSQLRLFEAEDGDSALRQLKKERIDIVLLDLNLPNTDAIGLVELISIKYPHSYILVFSMLPEAIYARRILKAGAQGFLSKESSHEEVKRAFDLALAGKKYISNAMSELLVNEVTGVSSDNPFEYLSHREFEIVSLLLTGNNLSRISRLLNIKPSTAGTYKARIFDKLKVVSVLELKEIAILYGFTPTGSNL